MKEINVQTVDAQIERIETLKKMFPLCESELFVLACLRRLFDLLGVEDDLNNVVTLLENKEWAEHCTHSDLGKRLESLITELHDEAAEPGDSGFWGRAAAKETIRANIAEEKLAALTANKEPFMYGIMTADGRPYFDEFCVSSDPALLEEEIKKWNEDLTDDEVQDRVVPLFTTPPAPAADLATDKACDACIHVLSVLGFDHKTARLKDVLAEVERLRKIEERTK
ncbi:hypothetical protein BEE12_16205 [Pantoea agglomerans]|uniref:hypothetical protein n=1 Tax=Enterobacter agglomerans TaxID=549 RepID=UPI00083CDA3F|nr:hypothetical protein [Pantoea agglomerans]AOE41259.1 hypothetical protein BEE12_16205 [Pantoea agglomerans]